MKSLSCIPKLNEGSGVCLDTQNFLGYRLSIHGLFLVIFLDSIF